MLGSFYSLKIVFNEVVRAQSTISLMVTPSFLDAVLMSSKLRAGEEEMLVIPDKSLSYFFFVNMLTSCLANKFVIKILGIIKIAIDLTRVFYKNVASFDLRKKLLSYCSLMARVMLVTDTPSQKL